VDATAGPEAVKEDDSMSLEQVVSEPSDLSEKPKKKSKNKE
jgi:hypothetical protein